MTYLALHCELWQRHMWGNLVEVKVQGGGSVQEHSCYITGSVLLHGHNLESIQNYTCIIILFDLRIMPGSEDAAVCNFSQKILVLSPAIWNRSWFGKLKTSLAWRLYIFRRADLNLATSASPSSVRSIWRWNCEKNMKKMRKRWEKDEKKMVKRWKIENLSPD